MNIKDSINRKTNYIGIDIDDKSIFNFLLTYFALRERFKDAEIITEISSSGGGFHIIVKLKKEITIIENWLERSLFDDSMRLMLNLRKFYLSEGKDKNHDLIFTEKAGKKVKKFNMDNVLRNYRNDVKEIEKLWGSNEALEKIKILAEKIEKDNKIPIKDVWITTIGIKGEVMKEKIKKIAEDISMQDESFKWHMFISYFPDYDFCLCIKSNSKTQAFQRGSWFRRIVKKELNEDILYYVKKI